MSINDGKKNERRILEYIKWVSEWVGEEEKKREKCEEKTRIGKQKQKEKRR